MKRTDLARWLILAALGTAGCPEWFPPKSEYGPGPAAFDEAGPSPSELLAQRTPPASPPLTTAEDVPAFVAWASKSTAADRETVRVLIGAASANDAVAQGLIDEIEKTWQSDDTYALVAMSILGEMRNPVGVAYLGEFVDRPLVEGLEVHGEVPAQVSQETLQAKAISGIAYLDDPNWNGIVLRTIGAHPSLIVRAEAIRAYLFNQGDNIDTRGIVLQYVIPGEERYVDRPGRIAGDTAESFNERLSAYLAAYPEVIPPGPTKLGLGHAKENGAAFDVSPPAF